MDTEIANLLGALSLAVMDRIEQGAREVMGRGGETPAALYRIPERSGWWTAWFRISLSNAGRERTAGRSRCT
jgi:MarR family transcriptional repressor of emrRAB